MVEVALYYPGIKGKELKRIMLRTFDNHARANQFIGNVERESIDEYGIDCIVQSKPGQLIVEDNNRVQIYRLEAA